MAYKNKIVFDGETLIDLTEDTITPNDLRVGVTAHDMSGAPIVGTMVSSTTGGTVITELPYQDGELYYNGSELTPTWANYDPEIMEIWGEKSATGSGDYEVTFYLADGYVWPDGSNAYKTTWTINEPNYYDTFGDNDPGQIHSAVALGIASSLWAVGDMIAITLNGTVGVYTFNEETYYAFILGFNHNMALETGEKYNLTLQFGKTAANSNIAFVDSYYGSTSGIGFVMNTSGSNSGGWEGSYMRQTICPAFFDALPDNWQKVISTITKYTENTGGGSGSSTSHVTPTNEQVFLLAEYEVFGVRTYANQYEQNSQEEYDYYAMGNSKIKYQHSKLSTASYWWMRSAVYSSGGNFCRVNESGGADSGTAYYSRGLAPAFVIT